MQDFQYYTPTKVYFGQNAETQVGAVLRERGCRRVLLHYGGGSVKSSGLLGRITDSLQGAGIEFVELGGVAPNPKLEQVRQGVQFCRAHHADMILAVGGGSVIDSAKSIGVCAASGLDPWDIITAKATPRTTIPVGVVLTISAAGSEMSDSHVITNEALHLKRG
ncbi:MAG: iron-containing alcohol dehydrogenase, partial [Clostridiales bacterium]|nr:iron-containing alcohol dehydrogenase [Clostridiales bacterium]